MAIKVVVMATMIMLIYLLQWSCPWLIFSSCKVSKGIAMQLGT